MERKVCMSIPRLKEGRCTYVVGKGIDNEIVREKEKERIFSIHCFMRRMMVTEGDVERGLLARLGVF